MRPALASLVLILTLVQGSAQVWASAPAPGSAATPPRSGNVIEPAASSSRAPASASDLLARMRDAMVRQGSVHVDFRMVSALYPSGRAATHLRGDVSWKLQLLHDRTVVRRMPAEGPGSVPLDSLDLRLVGGRVASQSRSGQWQCQSAGHVQVMSTLLGLEGSVLTARIAGAGVEGGTPVWQVEATGYSPATGSFGLAHILYEISQRDDTLLRVQVTGAVTLAGHTQHVQAVEVYSRYGEPVYVRLPAVCAAS